MIKKGLKIFSVLAAALTSIGTATVQAQVVNLDTNLNIQKPTKRMGESSSMRGEVKQFVNLDAQLLAIYQLIQQKNMQKASADLNKLLEMYPNFRLAQGLKLALSNNQPTTKLEKDLRHEAEVRIASIIAPVDKKAIPMAFLQMASWQKTAILVDAYSARLYMYENSKGRPKYIFDNYMSIGKNGMIKKREGDHKTPIGVYHLEQFIPRAKLAPIYGFGAMTLNFPNDWDRFNKIGGTNIWLHGVPYDTYSRAPLSSRGCVALSNRDGEELFKFSQINNTPVAINTKHQWFDFKTWEQQQAIARQLFKQWLISYNAQQQQKQGAKFAPLTTDPNDVAMYSYPNLHDIQKTHSAESFLEFNGNNLEKMLKEQTQPDSYYAQQQKQQMLISKMSQENKEQQSIIDQMSNLLMFEFFVNGKRIWQYWQKSDNNWRLIYTNM